MRIEQFVLLIANMLPIFMNFSFDVFMDMQHLMNDHYYLESNSFCGPDHKLASV